MEFSVGADQIALATMSKRVPTERQVLRCIYDMYEPLSPAEGSTAGKVFVQIDVEAIARKVDCEKNIPFGYLYSHLDHKYRYQTGESTFVHLFAPRAGDLKHAINLPHLAAILAGLEQEYSKFIWSLGVSLVALALSVGSIIAPQISSR